MPKLFKLLLLLTVLCLTMQPLFWYAWGVVFVLFVGAFAMSLWRGMA